MIEPSPSSNKVFLVHGRNRDLAARVNEMLGRCGATVVDFTEVRQSDSFRGRYVGDVLDHAFSVAQAVVVILSGDDEVTVHPRFRLREDPRLQMELQPRPNVLIELGMALRSHADRVVLLEFPPMRKASDIDGLVTVSFTGDIHQLVTSTVAKLRQAGCNVTIPALGDSVFEYRLLRAARPRALDRLSHSVRMWLAAGISTAVAASLAAVLFAQPPICDASCQRAHQFWGQADALWHEASDQKSDRLFDKSLERFRQAQREQPTNIRYVASVAATMNDLGRHAEMLKEMAPFAASSGFATSKDQENKPWLLAELAAAYDLLGNEAKSTEYLNLAAASSPNLREWFAKTVSRYRQQAEARRR